MTKKTIEIINLSQSDIDRLYPDSDAPKLARIMGVQYSDEVQKFFQTMKSIVMIYIYLHNREQNLSPSEEYKKTKRSISYMNKLILSAEVEDIPNRHSFNINVALEKEWALKKPSKDCHPDMLGCPVTNHELCPLASVIFISAVIVLFSN
jgi:hypothetical protein